MPTAIPQEVPAVDAGDRHARKVERLIGTMVREWSRGQVYESSAARARALGPWLEHYNHRRPHRSLGDRPPCTRLPGRL